MKQYITVEQAKEINELNAKTRFELGFRNGRDYIDVARELTIGKMIEILKEYGNIEGFYTSTEHSIVTLYNDNGANHFDECNLCDALWEAVKEVIK